MHKAETPGFPALISLTWQISCWTTRSRDDLVQELGTIVEIKFHRKREPKRFSQKSEIVFK